jgi:hypothetical protein
LIAVPIRGWAFALKRARRSSSAVPSPPLTEYFHILSLRGNNAVISHFDRLSSSDTETVARSGPMAVSVRNPGSVLAVSLKSGWATSAY